MRGNFSTAEMPWRLSERYAAHSGADEAESGSVDTGLQGPPNGKGRGANGAPWRRSNPAVKAAGLPDPGGPGILAADWEAKLERAKAAFKVYDRPVDDLVAEARDTRIGTEKENEDAVERAAQVKRLIKGMEETRKKLIKEPDRYVRDVNAFVKMYRDKLQKVQRTLSRKITDWDDYRELERRKAEAAAARAVAAENARIAEEAERHGVEPVRIAAPVEPRRTGPIRTESGKAVKKMTWAWECENKGLVPEEYKILDEVRINQAVRAGIHQISGLRIYERKSTDIRVN